VISRGQKQGEKVKEYEIKDYAIIGNCETAALINTDGGIDWLCLPAFDGPSFFGAILDREKGGEFYIRPAISYRTERHYVDDSAILVTRFITDRGIVELRDFFVIARKKNSRFYDFTLLQPARKLIRTVRLVEGNELPMEIAVRARPDYGRKTIHWQKKSGASISDEAVFYSDLDLKLDGGDLTVRFSITQGKGHYVICDYGKEHSEPDPEQIERWYRLTESFWREWNLFNYYRGPYQTIIRRSAVTLKLLTYASTGAFVAAPTTSLPESFGGEQNWDYRYVWVRDTSLFIDAFFRLGYSGEAKAFFQFITRQCMTEHEQCMGQGKRPEAMIKVLYGIRPESLTEEQYLDHLSGYRSSKPVRIGNRAANQFQIDNYGHLLQTLYYFKQTGGEINAKMKGLAEEMVKDVLEHWQKPDNGIWEMPEKKNYTYGKMMAWVALQRASALGLGRGKDLEAVSDEIQKQVIEKGIKEENGREYLLESYESNDVDAGGLLGFTSGFLQERYASGTREQIEKHLAAGPFVYRNQEQRYQWKEGAFLLCSFWRINHLIREGEMSAAEDLLKEILKHASPLGLYAEEMDPATGEFMGNFPQGFSHLGLIMTILNLEAAKKDSRYSAMPDEKKFSRLGATVGWKGVVSGFLRVPGTIPLLWSGQSKWPG